MLVYFCCNTTVITPALPKTKLNKFIKFVKCSVFLDQIFKKPTLKSIFWVNKIKLNFYFFKRIYSVH